MRNSLLNETLVTPLLGCLPQVHLLWEMMLTGEPMVVMALTPAISSQVVLSLVRSGTKSGGGEGEKKGGGGE